MAVAVSVLQEVPMTLRWYLLISSLSVASCGYSTPYRSSGPAISKAGVEIRLAGERCYVNRSAEQFPTVAEDDRLHLDVSLQLANTTSKPVQVSLDRFQLVEGTSAEQVVMSPSERDILTLSPSETRTIALDFEKDTSLDCRHDFLLAANDAVVLDGARVDISSIDFQPVR
jgi:hypothetical protein